MNTSTIEARRGPGKRFGVVLLGFVVACAGAFSLSAAKADAAGFEMQFDKGAINLGAAFKGQQILPAPKAVTLGGETTRAAYWWDAFDTGFATQAANAWQEGVGAKFGPDADPPANVLNATAVTNLAAPLSQINACITQYAAAPPKPDNEPSTAGPNVNWPCLINPAGGTVGGTDSGYLGSAPCTAPGTTTPPISGPCTLPITGKAVRGWPGPIQNFMPDQATFATLYGTPFTPLGMPTSQWAEVGETITNANTDGQRPLGFADMMVPYSDTSFTTATGPNNERILNLKIGANAFRFPLMVVPSPLDGSPVPITLAVTGAPFIPGTNDAGKTEDELYVKGTYNTGTGELSLEGALESRVLVGLGIDAVPESPPYPEDPPEGQKGGPTPFVYCATPLADLTLNTTGGSTGAGSFPGAPFYGGLEGEGAVAGSFNITEDSVPTVHPLALAGKDNPDAYTGDQAPDCGTVNTVTKGQGALWLGSGDVEAPICEANQVGNYPDCQDPRTSYGKPVLKVKKTVKAGKKIRLTVRVRNTGNVEGTARVRVQTSNGKAKAPKLTVGVTADPGANGSRTIKLATKKRTKGKVVLYATVGNRTGKATVRIKK